MSTVVWFTGLSGAGKSTIASALASALEARGRTVAIIDGDEVRATLHQRLGFTPEDIRENNRLIAGLAKGRVGQTDFILVPIISPFRDSRALAKNIIGDDFVELYVASSEAARVARDPKGLYKRARAGALPDFIGYGGVLYEEPERPDLIIRTDGQSVDESVADIMRFLGSRRASSDRARGHSA